ncbi:MAG TPA: hypothetical protein PLA19_00650 [Candidatus Pacearchaeota archaeon]|nr:hypothetical protein [Candidatus Pacearchaeota archaeon]
MGIETLEPEKIESPEKQGVIENLAGMLKDRTRGFIGKVGALGITHPSGRQLAMVGTLMATRIMIVGTPDFDLLTGGMVGLDEMVESFGEAVSQQGVVPEAVDIDPDKVFYDKSWWDNPGYEDRWPADPSAGETQQPNPIGTGLEKTPVDSDQKQAVEWLSKGGKNLMENPPGGKEPFSGSYPDFPDENKIKEAVEGGGGGGNIGDLNKGGGIGVGKADTSFKADGTQETSFKADGTQETSFKTYVAPKGGIGLPESERQDPTGLDKVGEGENSKIVDASSVSRDGESKAIKIGKVVQGETPKEVEIGNVVKGHNPEAVPLGNDKQLKTVGLGNQEKPETVPLGQNPDSGDHEKMAYVGKLLKKIKGS